MRLRYGVIIRFEGRRIEVLGPLDRFSAYWRAKHALEWDGALSITVVKILQQEHKV